MNKGDLQTAVQIAWLQMLADTHIDPKEMTDFDKMLFTIAFSKGCDYVSRELSKVVMEAR